MFGILTDNSPQTGEGDSLTGYQVKVEKRFLIQLYLAYLKKLQEQLLNSCGLD
jgi:hypothetical protein